MPTQETTEDRRGMSVRTWPTRHRRWPAVAAVALLATACGGAAAPRSIAAHSESAKATAAAATSSGRAVATVTTPAPAARPRTGAVAGSASTACAGPCVFRVGSAVADLTPAPGVPVYSGGFGSSPPIVDGASPPGDSLSARALYVGNGRHGVALVTVDSQGLFAALQQASTTPGTSGYGSADMRHDAAAAVSALGAPVPAMTQADIIVQGTHSHSAPTAMGIWGPVDIRYLQEIHDRVVSAIVAAARAAQPAELQYATIDAPYIDNVNTNQTDSYEGWVQDGQISVLRAVSPVDGSTLVTYANVPAHPDILNGAGTADDCIAAHTPMSQCPALSGDHFGVERSELEQQLGGTGIVGGGTLGREESPVQVGGQQRMFNYGRGVTELITRALTSARWVTDDSVGGAETMVVAPGTNPLLFGLLAAWVLPDAQKDQVWQQTGEYPIDRSLMPPYQNGSVVGTPATALRIGNLAYVSLNGEAFPEVRHSILAAVTQPGVVVVGLSLGNDQLGYYEPSVVWPFSNGVTPYHSDHFEYNISPALGDAIIQGQVLNLRSLGFSTMPVGVPVMENNNWPQALHTGLQALAYPAQGDAGPGGTFTTTLEGIWGDEALQSTLGASSSLSGPVHWDLGDGTTVLTPLLDGRHTQTVTHAWAADPSGAPRVYDVHLTATSTSGDVATWDLQVTVYPRLVAAVSATTNADGSVSYTASASGGDGDVLAWRWVFADGSTASGPSVTHTFAGGVTPGATLTVTDGTGSEASATA